MNAHYESVMPDVALGTVYAYSDTNVILVNGAPALGTAFKHVHQIDQTGAGKWGDYKLVSLDTVGGTQGTIQRYTFRPDFTDKMRSDPMGLGGPWWKEEWDIRDYPWDAELHKLRFVRDWSAPHQFTDMDGGSAYMPRLMSVRKYREALSCPTKVRIRHFFSDKPFDFSKKCLSTPQPQEVRWDVAQSAERFVCLHKRVRVPCSRYMGAVGASAADTMPVPATNFPQRRPHVIPGPPVAMNGAFYHYEEHTVFPPRQTKLLKLRV